MTVDNLGAKLSALVIQFEVAFWVGTTALQNISVIFQRIESWNVSVIIKGSINLRALKYCAVNFKKANPD